MFKLFDRKQGTDNTYNKCNRYVVVLTIKKLTLIAYNFSKDNEISPLTKSADGFRINGIFPEFKTSMFLSHTSTICGPGSVVGIATAYGLDGPGIESRWGEIFRTCPDRP